MKPEYSMETRHAKILELLHEQGEVKVSDLSTYFDISEVTIRNDLSKLESNGLLSRVYGGAVSIKQPYHSIVLSKQVSKNTDEKKKVAKKIASLIKEGETIMINSGYTTLFIARELANIRNLDVVTNSLAIAMELTNRPNINLILLGGNINSDCSFTFGDDAISTLEHYRADKLILSVDGISTENGISTHHYLESKLNQTMIERSNKTYIAADSSKVGVESFSFIAPITAVDLLVTDAASNNPALQDIARAGVEVLTTED